jgi:hypothetical protein
VRAGLLQNRNSAKSEEKPWQAVARPFLDSRKFHPIVLATSRIVLALVFSFSFPFYKQVLLYLLLLSPKGFCALKLLLSLVVVPVVAVSKKLLLSLSLSLRKTIFEWLCK